MKLTKEQFIENTVNAVKRVGLDISVKQAEMLYTYKELLVDWNEKINLTAVTEDDEVIVKHIVDSLYVAKYIKEGDSVIDVGTGAGLPGMILAIYFDGKAEFTLFDANTIKIISDRSTFTLISLDYTNFPNINFDVKSEVININSLKLKNFIKQTAFAAGLNETRLVLTGVCLETKQKDLQMIATDSYRLAKKISTNDEDYPKTKVIIPSKSIEELSKILEDETETVKMSFANNRALFEYKNISFITRLIEGNFPDTSSIIPTEHIVELTFNKNELLSTVDRASLFTTQNNGSIIKLITSTDGVVQIASISTEILTCFLVSKSKSFEPSPSLSFSLAE